MPSLAEDLQTQKCVMEDFRSIAERVLNYMPEMITEEIDFGNYLICASTTAGNRKTIRPYKKNLFINNPNQFNDLYNQFIHILEKIQRDDKNFENIHYSILDKVIYTIQQSIGIGLDFLVEQNSSKKHVGNRFEELIRTLLTEMNIPNKKVVLRIPYETEEGKKYYRCETDVIISPYESVRSDMGNIDPKEIVISLKTSTKDRMPKIFIDKILLERFLDHPVRMIGISQNDIQRKEDKGKIKVSYTFVSNLFMVYTKFLTELEGYYYIDIPKRALETPFNKHIYPFSKFILKDVWELLNT
ncbi:hypothetical protein ES708_24725 [subsurface metagenome]